MWNGTETCDLASATQQKQHSEPYKQITLHLHIHISCEVSFTDSLTFRVQEQEEDE